jgi:enoyl-CoA hydratase/carnithine racemase
MASDDPKTKVVVIHGGKFFSAGADLSGLAKKIEEN